MDFTRRVIGEKEYMIKYIPKRLSDNYVFYKEVTVYFCF